MEGSTYCSSFGFPWSTSYCVISPWALSARKTLWPNSTGVNTLPRLIRSVWGSKMEKILLASRGSTSNQHRVRMEGWRQERLGSRQELTGRKRRTKTSLQERKKGKHT